MGQISETNFLHLYTILVAHINYLQGEYASLVVQSTFDTDTAKLFRCLEKNNSAFPPDTLENLSTAAEITSVTTTVRQNQPNNRGAGRFRPFQHRGYHPRGGYNQQDPFNQYTNRSFPNRRGGFVNNNNLGANTPSAD